MAKKRKQTKKQAAAKRAKRERKEARYAMFRASEFMGTIKSYSPSYLPKAYSKAVARLTPDEQANVQAARAAGYTKQDIMGYIQTLDTAKKVRKQIEDEVKLSTVLPVALRTEVAARQGKESVSPVAAARETISFVPSVNLFKDISKNPARASRGIKDLNVQGSVRDYKSRVRKDVRSTFEKWLKSHLSQKSAQIVMDNMRKMKYEQLLWFVLGTDTSKGAWQYASDGVDDASISTAEIEIVRLSYEALQRG